MNERKKHSKSVITLITVKEIKTKVKDVIDITHRW